MKCINFLVFIFISYSVHGQSGQTVYAQVDFSYPLNVWDGFGVNYVETSQTLDYNAYPQDYGGFSILTDQDKKKVIDMVFGEDGLKPSIVKMFLDPLHQMSPGGPFDHETTTSNMRHFVREGLKLTRKRGDDLSILTTLYGPPAFANTLKQLRGKYLDPSHKLDVANYMISWVKYLKDNEKFPVKYLSLHNEGEDWQRMPIDGGPENISHDHLDYNMYWPPEQVVDFLKFMRPMMDEEGLSDVGLAPGEPTNWYRFNSMGYARAIIKDQEALQNLGLITSHGFYNGRFWRLFSGTSNHGTWEIQKIRPDLHAWTTSMSWERSTLDFVNLIYYHIYLARVNAVIPWAFIQRPNLWANGDPNPGNAFTVLENKTLEVTKGYYLYKQLTRAGQTGMNVCYTSSMDPSILLLAFGKNETENKDAFVIINNGYSFSGITDAVEVKLMINNHHFDYYFGYKEPIGTANRTKIDLMKNTQYKMVQTSEGYILEAAIPWKNFGVTPQSINSFSMDLQVNSGAEDKEGIIGWQKSSSSLGPVVFSKKSKDKDSVGLMRTNQKIKIDGVKENAWTSGDMKIAEHERLERGRFLENAEFSILYDDNFLYLWVNVIDGTNLPHKRLHVKIEGSESKVFEAFRTSETGERYQSLGKYHLENGVLIYDCPGHSVTTFFAVD